MAKDKNMPGIDLTGITAKNIKNYLPESKLDTGDLNRLGKKGILFLEGPPTVALIDAEGEDLRDDISISELAPDIREINKLAKIYRVIRDDLTIDPEMENIGEGVGKTFQDILIENSNILKAYMAVVAELESKRDAKAKDFQHLLPIIP